MAALLRTRAVGQPGGRHAVARRRRTAARPDSLHGAVCGVLQQGLRSTSLTAIPRAAHQRACPRPSTRSESNSGGRSSQGSSSPNPGEKCVLWGLDIVVGWSGQWSRSGPRGRDPGCRRRGLPAAAVGCPSAEKDGDRRGGRAGGGDTLRRPGERRTRRQPVRVRDQLLLQVHPDRSGSRGRRRPHEGPATGRSQCAAAGFASCGRSLCCWLYLEGVSAAKVHRRACPQPIRPSVAAHGSCRLSLTVLIPVQRTT